MEINSLHRRLHLASLLFALATMAGCGRNGSPAATQVAAQVNSDEITVHQINAVLARSPDVTNAAAPRAKREILDRLIDQQLAVQQAIGRKLDRSPYVVQALAMARAEILARAYAEEVARAQPKPTADEIKEYFAAHPGLFAERRVFVLEEIRVTAPPSVAAGLRERIAGARSMQDVAAWLRSRDVKFAENRGLRAAEQIALEKLPRLQAMQDGEIELFDEGAGRIDVIRMVAARPAPVDEATAAPRIQQFLFNQRASDALVREMKLNKERSKIRYLGEFAAAPASEESPRAVADNSGGQNTPSPRTRAAPNSSVEKGVRGLR